MGMMELLILLILAVPIGIGALLLIVFLMRRGGGNRVADLEAENRRLRDELDERDDPAERSRHIPAPAVILRPPPAYYDRVSRCFPSPPRSSP